MISYLLDFLRGQMEFTDFIIIIGSLAFVVFCSTTLHEYAHALTAVKLGDDTPRLRGRLTINPVAHIDLIGIIMIFLFGFGYAKPVEVRMRNFKKPKRDMAIVALAGPICNLLQAFVAMFIYSGLYFIAVKNQAIVLLYLARFFLYVAVLNINLAMFNLLPVPPLDGSRLVTALLPSKYYYGLMKYERYIMIGLFVLLFTGVLSAPLSWISDIILELFSTITSLPFGMIG